MKKSDILAILSITDDPIDLYKISTEFELEDMIPDIERAFRQSREYKGYIFWQKSKHEQATCSALNLNTYDYNTLTLEMHHYPLTLWDITLIVGLKKLSELPEDTFYTTFDIVSELIKLHFENKIGIVPLTKTYHQMYHEGIYTIDKKHINGNHSEFIEEYKDYIPKHIQIKYDAAVDGDTSAEMKT